MQKTKMTFEEKMNASDERFREKADNLIFIAQMSDQIDHLKDKVRELEHRNKLQDIEITNLRSRLADKNV